MKTHDSSEKVVQEAKLYTGLALFHVIAVNPTLEEMAALSIRQPRKEPTYTDKLQDDKGVDYVRTRLDFWVRHEQVTTKMTIFVDSRERMNRNGDKYEWINTHGQSSWAPEMVGEDNKPTGMPEDLPDWFELDTVRKAYVGEVQLHNFIWAWGNVKTGLTQAERKEGAHTKDLEASLDTMDKIVKGDIKELKSYVKSLAKNRVRLLLGVKDMRFQDVYTGYFGRESTESLAYWKQALEDEYSRYDADFQGSLQLQRYTPTGDIDLNLESAEAVSSSEEAKADIGSDFD